MFGIECKTSSKAKSCSKIVGAWRSPKLSGTSRREPPDQGANSPILRSIFAPTAMSVASLFQLVLNCPTGGYPLVAMRNGRGGHRPSERKPPDFPGTKRPTAGFIGSKMSRFTTENLILSVLAKASRDEQLLGGGGRQTNIAGRHIKGKLHTKNSNTRVFSI